MTSDMKCKTCKWFTDGECRRHSPEVTREPVSTDSVTYYIEITFWPKVSPSHFCGDWCEVVA